MLNIKKGYLNLSNDYTNYSSNKKRITDFDRAKAYILYIYIYISFIRDILDTYSFLSKQFISQHVATNLKFQADDNQDPLLIILICSLA